jgi:hypothetical protein
MKLMNTNKDLVQHKLHDVRSTVIYCKVTGWAGSGEGTVSVSSLIEL